MPDITMCSGANCPLKDECYRYTAEPSKFKQSYFMNPPIKDGKCEYQMEVYTKATKQVVKDSLTTQTIEERALELYPENSDMADIKEIKKADMKEEEWEVSRRKELELELREGAYSIDSRKSKILCGKNMAINYIIELERSLIDSGNIEKGVSESIQEQHSFQLNKAAPSKEDLEKLLNDIWEEKEKETGVRWPGIKYIG